MFSSNEHILLSEKVPLILPQLKEPPKRQVSREEVFLTKIPFAYASLPSIFGQDHRVRTMFSRFESNLSSGEPVIYRRSTRIEGGSYHTRSLNGDDPEVAPEDGSRRRVAIAEGMKEEEKSKRKRSVGHCAVQLRSQVRAQDDEGGDGLDANAEELCQDRPGDEYFRLNVEGDCRDVVRCDKATEIGVTRLATVRCPTGLAFDIERQTCDWKTNVKNCDQLESKRPLID
ncbi:hypothetical protein WN55_06683 [Dufourea novaeangliae]|uniref:Chitin-binding type-2 domain-containing protein n=1 Tax=Dufourea novaeangliae TaxID=178035 RepID=A0A154PS98_DUFNO|nr:hypothetical protein WN55_06683 [Dufourea novaeangliae]